MTFVSDVVSGDRPLTPNHFLIGEGVSDGPIVEGQESNLLPDMYERSREELNRFWKVWSEDYLRNLPCIVPQFDTERGCLKLGSVVLIHEDNTARLDWILGRVIELYPGRDRRVRSAKLQTSKGSLVRAVQRLHKLEVLDPPDEINAGSANENNDPLTDNMNVTPDPAPTPGSSLDESVPCSENKGDETEPKTSRYGRKYKSVKRLDL